MMSDGAAAPCTKAIKSLSSSIDSLDSAQSQIAAGAFQGAIVFCRQSTGDTGHVRHRPSQQEIVQSQDEVMIACRTAGESIAESSSLQAASAL